MELISRGVRQRGFTMKGTQHLVLAISATLSLIGGTGCSTTPNNITTTSIVDGKEIQLHRIAYQDDRQYLQQEVNDRRLAYRIKERQTDEEIYSAALLLGFGHRQAPPAKAQRVYMRPRPQHQSRVQQPRRPPVRQAAYQLRRVVAQRNNVRHQRPQHNYGSMWGRVRSGYRMGRELHNPVVQKVLRQYATKPKRLNRIFKRSAKYLHFVLSELKRRNMPTELVLLPMVESAYTNRAVSRSGAVGMWQFMPATGKQYGLKRARGYDARMDIFASTRAALTYLQRINRQFKGDWYLTLAAYNAGENKIHRERAKNRLRGKRTDYWSLNLSKETREYVPRLLAYKEILNRPRAYGVHLPRASNVPTLTQASINKPVDLRQIARAVGLPSATLTELNPNFKTGITKPHLSRGIVMPRQYARAIHDSIQRAPVARRASYSGKRKVSKRYKSKRRSKRLVNYRVRSGESLYKIAVSHGTTVKHIMRLNGLRSPYLKAGTRIRIAVKKRYG